MATDWSLDENAYVALTVDRVIDMLKLSTGKPAIDYIDTNKNPPFWFIYEKKFSLSPIGDGLNEQTWTFGLIYVVAHATAGYDGKYQRQMRVDLPAAINYFNSHPNLTYRGNGTITDHLQPHKHWGGANKPPIRSVGIFGLDKAERYLGFELDLTAVYKIPTPTEGV